MNSLLAFIGVCFGLVLSSGASGQTAYMTYRDVVKKTSSNYVELLVPHLNNSTRAVVQSTNFDLTSSHDIYAYTYIDKGKREVRVSLGMIFIMTQVNYAYAVAAEYDEMGCFESYLVEISELVRKNGVLRSKKINPVLVPAFHIYVSGGAGACSGVSTAAFSDPEPHKYLASAMNSSLAYLYGHELGHQVLNHLVPNDGVGMSKKEQLERSRKNEAAADAWSLDMAYKIKQNPIIAFPFMIFFSIANHGDVQTEKESTHPSSLRRYIDFLDKIGGWYDQPIAYENKFGVKPSQSMIDQLNDMRALAKEIFDLMQQY